MIKRLLTAFLLLPVAASAHPGHDGLTTFVHPSKHILSGIESTLIVISLVLLTAAAIWFVKRR